MCKLNSILVVSFILVGAGPSSATMVKVGELSTLQYEVAGTVYIVDEDTLKIEDFNYNGKGPDAFFYVGESGSPSGSGTLVPYPKGSDGDTILTKADKIDVVLKLPSGIREKKRLCQIMGYFGQNQAELILSKCKFQG